MIKTKNMLEDLEYVDAIESKRQTYYIYRGKKYYLILSFSPKKKNSGNFNLVNSKLVDKVYDKFRNQKKITSSAVFCNSKVEKQTRYIKSSLDALNILYILSAKGFAKLDKRFTRKNLFFNIK